VQCAVPVVHVRTDRFSRRGDHVPDALQQRPAKKLKRLQRKQQHPRREQHAIITPRARSPVVDVVVHRVVAEGAQRLRQRDG
jgi:hypothetical protein